MDSPATSPTTTFAMPSDREAVMTRVFHAPRALVFQALTDPTLIPRWWGPRHLTTTVDVLDARPGGRWRFVQRDDKGNVHGFNGTFLELAPPERIVQTFEYEGAPGHISTNTTTLEERDGVTTLTQHARFQTPEDLEEMGRDGMEFGWRESMDRLLELLAGEEPDREIVMERTFDAPRALVFRAWTDPEQLARWWGPNGFTTTISQMDARPGGVARFVMHGPDGTDYPNLLVYTEVAPPERLIYLHSGDVEGDESGRFQVTVTFADVGGMTHLVMRMRFASRAEREQTVAFGAVELGYQTLAHLAELLAAA